jgi:hypothetical protein
MESVPNMETEDLVMEMNGKELLSTTLAYLPFHLKEKTKNFDFTFDFTSNSNLT